MEDIATELSRKQNVHDIFGYHKALDFILSEMIGNIIYVYETLFLSFWALEKCTSQLSKTFH